jgi:hypothetical protein
MITPEAANTTEETVFTPAEIAKIKKLHPATVRKIFLEEPGVIRLGHPAGSRAKNGQGARHRQYYTIRIPESVANRVFARMTVGSEAARHAGGS